jgi:hypothetical protein
MERKSASDGIPKEARLASTFDTQGSTELVRVEFEVLLPEKRGNYANKARNLRIERVGSGGVYPSGLETDGALPRQGRSHGRDGSKTAVSRCEEPRNTQRSALSLLRRRLTIG